ncbi:MAG: NUDIX hydrolase [Firmicutes bacterium]|nr:NUDIX hydrolase [Bacillota bacterium]
MTKNFDLESALKKFRPFDKVEAEHLDKVLAFVGKGEDLFTRENKQGHIVGSAFLFNRDLSKILLNFHKKLNRWNQFGGHSDGEKNTMSVAARELQEESGITNFEPLLGEIADVESHVYPAKNGEPEHIHYDIRFFFVTDEEKFQTSDESKELRWFTLDEFKNEKSKILDSDDARKRLLAKWQIAIG